ncbi:hypothetical protein ABIB35_003097 [Arthrobacter sp. UYP6]|uniref:hypothetical protein n=1 Tax=Arthrobacter sp. UYP6 TaxID=1756378 RepID=UPI003390B5DA
MGQDNHNGGDPRERDQAPRPEPDQNDDDGGRPASAAPGVPPAPQWGAPEPPPPSAPGPPPPNTPISSQQGPPGQQPQQWGPPGQQPQQQGPPGQQPQQWGPPGQQPHNPWDRQSPQWGPPAPQPGAPAQPWGAPGYLQQGGWTPPPKPGVIPLRPLGLGELLDGAFQACRKNPGATFGTALLIQAVISLLTFVFAGGLLSTTVYSTNFDTSEFEVSGSDVAWSLTGLTLLGVVSVVGVLLLQGVLVVPIARSILNLKTGFAPTWKLCRSRLLALAGLGLVLTAMAVAGLVVFGVLLGLLASVMGAAGVPVVIIGVLALVAVFVWLVVGLPWPLQPWSWNRPEFSGRCAAPGC